MNNNGRTKFDSDLLHAAYQKIINIEEGAMIVYLGKALIFASQF